MIGLLSFAGVGCSDFLEVTSDQELTYDTFYKTASDCRSATAALYNAVWFNFNSKFMWEIGDAARPIICTSIWRLTLLPYSTVLWRLPIRTIWRMVGTRCIPVIGQADHILNNIYRASDNGVDAEVVNACKGEARFMRGWLIGI